MTDLFDDFDCIADLLHGFCEVDDVDSVAFFENETFHFRVPTVLLVSKMSTASKQFFNGDFDVGFSCSCQALSLYLLTTASSPLEEDFGLG